MFRPCIDLHEGKVKQIVGGSLAEGSRPRTNFVSEQPAAWFAELYKRDGLGGGHVIQLGPGNETEARAALAAFPGGLQIGGGIHAANARDWLDAGASHVIVTSWIFREGRLDEARLAELVKIASQSRLVLDLSCRRRGADYFVVTDRWQKFTELRIAADTLRKLARSCSEFLIHAVDVEGHTVGAGEDRPDDRLGAGHFWRQRRPLRGRRRLQPPGAPGSVTITWPVQSSRRQSFPFRPFLQPCR
jgi:phosphoribosylformimino-5-aminoimidazole carboxamide ribotide isomerase